MDDEDEQGSMGDEEESDEHQEQCKSDFAGTRLQDNMNTTGDYSDDYSEPYKSSHVTTSNGGENSSSSAIDSMIYNSQIVDP